MVSPRRASVSRGVEAWLTPHGRRRRNRLHADSVNKALGVKLATQARRRKIRTRGREPRVAGGTRRWQFLCDAAHEIADLLHNERPFHRSLHDHIAAVLLIALARYIAEAPIVSSARVITGLVTPSFLARPRTVCGGGSDRSSTGSPTGARTNHVAIAHQREMNIMPQLEGLNWTQTHLPQTGDHCFGHVLSTCSAPAQRFVGLGSDLTMLVAQPASTTRTPGAPPEPRRLPGHRGF